ncbi:hypothetical protein BDV33DRAFT_183163 [Aspergillus novoparasiticus]|uniref:Serine/arginine repetitive matrix protein 1 n=1 Tax=Aspergillus novoparasiticus TaxID=986946 RepID=A0A5N6E9A2_9EURO|nr:hypothetical protein BDV33DRAFT_183163 [Aspergillus novoparasiticus]
MDWDRNRRFDDHRGGESYRPAGPRGYIRRSRSPRNRSPRLVADTWVPSSSRSYGRGRSRSPPAFRGRSSRSPSFYNRESGPSSYLKTCSPPRRFSPRREGRPRSPAPTSWRLRSPYADSRPRDFSRNRNMSKRLRDPSPNLDFRPVRRERPALTASDQYARPTSPSRRSLLRDNFARGPMVPRSRSPIQDGRRDRHAENYIGQRRRSPSPRGVPSAYISAPGSVSNSRRSSPFLDRASAFQFDNRVRSPASQPVPCRRLSKNSEHSPSRHEHATLSKNKPKKDNTGRDSPLMDGAGCSSEKGPEFDTSGRAPSLEIQGKDSSELNQAHSGSVPSYPRAYSAVQDHSPPSGPSHGPKSLSSQIRSSNISLLSAPTRPRGGPSFKENVWTGAPARRGPMSAGSYGPPTGPRSGHTPMPGPGVDTHRHSTYRQGSVTGVSYPRTPRYMNYLTGLSSIISGGRCLPSDLDALTEKRLSQLDADRDRLMEQIADTQRSKRVGIRDWDRLDRDSSICALKSELAEGHLQRIADGESAHVSAIF